MAAAASLLAAGRAPGSLPRAPSPLRRRRLPASVSPEGLQGSSLCSLLRTRAHGGHACGLKDRARDDTQHLDMKLEGLCRKNDSLASSMWGHSAVVLMAGLLIFGGSQQALATTELASTLPTDIFGDLGDITTGLASAFLLIFFSELGDKTFFIAALLAARNSGGVVFAGTFGALAAMTVISVFIGRAFHYVDGALPFKFGDVDFPVDDFAAVCLLVYFGITTLLDATSADEQKINEEKEEAEVAISGFSGNGAGTMAAASTVASTFLLVFVAEWGDKSFFSTIALAAASSPLGVIGGALAGHALATLLAVLGGSLIGTLLSEKTIAYIGGSLFLAFAAVTLFEIVN